MAHTRVRHPLRLVEPHIVEAALNHISGHKAGMMGVYNRAAVGGALDGCGRGGAR